MIGISQVPVWRHSFERQSGNRNGVGFTTDEPFLAGVPPVPTGQPMGGRYFPMLFDP